jgi:hypothetical protein
MGLRTGLALGAVAIACGHSAAQPSSQPAAAVAIQPLAAGKPAPLLASEVMGAPVRSERVWLTALAPNKRGTWNFITQAHELNSGAPTEFVVVDLATGKTKIIEDASQAHSTTQISNQLRAVNGRIFFPESDNYIAYYEPADETVKVLGQVIKPPADDRTIYRMVFGPDGKLYGGTQSTKLPTVFQLDPDTLKVKMIGHVGQNRLSYSYAYYLAADPPWLYVAVGQNPWELVAINIDTGVQKVLATRADNGFIQLDIRKEGISASLISGLRTPQQTREIVWCADGQTFPFSPPKDHVPLPFKARNVTPLQGAIVDAPDVDTKGIAIDEKGAGQVRWRAHGAADRWQAVSYKLAHTAPIDIESLTPLPDGTVLGNAKQYHGFFRFDPKTNSIAAFGPHGPSRGARAVVNGIVYITGYPNGVLFAYDPKQPWTSTKTVSEQSGVSTANPRRLGIFAATATKYAYFLVPSGNGKLYYLGRRERDGIGSGIGSYDIASQTFAGHNDGLSFFDPQGLVVDDDLKRVVFSGRLHDDPALPGKTPAEAQLILYDYDLKEVERRTIKPGLRNTGELFRTKSRGVIVGLVRDSKTTSVYRYDLVAKRLLAWKDLPGAAAASIQRPSDQSVWIVLDQVLTRIDPETLQVQSYGRLSDMVGEPEHLAWQGRQLYFSVHDELRRIVIP